MNGSATLPDVLAGLIRDRGPGLLGERRRLLGLLRDRSPGDVRTIRILMMAFDGGIPGRLSGTTPSSLDIGRESGLLAAETGLGPDVARQAVETWAKALCAYVPGDAAGVVPPGPRPSVRKLPPGPPAAARAGAAEPARTPGSRPGWKRRWPAIALGLVVALGGIARLVHPFGGGPVPQQPAAPSAPGTPSPTGATTPEGYALVTEATPYPSFATERVQGSQNTLGVWFGVKVDSEAVSYYVAYAFDKGQRRGQGLVGATQNGQKVGSGTVAADRIVETGTGKSFLRVAGVIAQNALRLPGLCALAQVGDSTDHIELVPGGLLAVFPLDRDGGCDMGNRIGFGTLK